MMNWKSAVWFLVSAVAMSGCGTPTEDDPTAQQIEQAPSLDGKTDDASIYGNYTLDGSGGYTDGDILSVSLFAAFDGSRSSPPSGSAGAFARVRAYGQNATPVAQTDTFGLFSHSGKTYIEFRGFVWNGNEQVPVVEDVYEYQVASGDLRLRKIYGSRWLQLAAVTDEQLCDKSGGTWDVALLAKGARGGSTTPCTCSDGTFVPGAGGCTKPLDIPEPDCRDTGGEYTDDDSTYLGTFCVCPSGTGLTDKGCEAL
jgi:hypothetical protein